MLEEHSKPYILSFKTIQINAVETALMVLKMHNKSVTKENILSLYHLPAWATADRWVAMVKNYFLNNGYDIDNGL